MQGWKGKEMAVKAGERNVPDTPQNRQLNAVWYARELAAYTIQICKNKKVFLPEYQSALTDDIIGYGHHLLSRGRIQSRRMFIQKQQLRCHNGTHQQCNYLSLPTG